MPLGPCTKNWRKKREEERGSCNKIYGEVPRFQVSWKRWRPEIKYSKSHGSGGFSIMIVGWSGGKTENSRNSFSLSSSLSNPWFIGMGPVRCWTTAFCGVFTVIPETQGWWTSLKRKDNWHKKTWRYKDFFRPFTPKNVVVSNPSSVNGEHSWGVFSGGAALDFSSPWTVRGLYLWGRFL